MSEHKYKLYAVILTVALMLGSLLPKIEAIKNHLDLLSFSPLPLYWCGLVLLMFFLLPRPYMTERLRLKGQVYGFAFSAAIIYLALRFGAGFLLRDVAASPYDLSPYGMLKNLWDICPFVIAREMTRAYALGTVFRNRVFLAVFISLITLIWCLGEINLYKITVLRSAEEWFIYIAKDVLPLLLQGCFLTALVICGGAMAGIIYFLTFSIFMRVFPFLPNLPWIAESALGIAFPVMATFALWGWHKVQAHTHTARRQESIGLFSALLAVTVGFAWFVTGVFPVYPSVILTGSMEPVILPGDVVLISKFAAEKEIYSLAENDIINFKREDITITHRIVAVIHDADGNVSFQTKGDNNKSEDEILVLPADLNGIVKKVVPKVGLPVLWLHGSDTIPEGVLDY